MTYAPLIVSVLLWVALAAWAVEHLAPRCRHDRLRGVANYYDRDLRCFIHLKECEDCHLTVITHER